MTQRRIHVIDSKVLILGLAFKENCPDLRNTRVIDMIDELNGYHAAIDVYDPWVNAEEAKKEYGLQLVRSPKPGDYDAIILAVGHHQFKALGSEGIRAFGKDNAVLFDVKYVLPKGAADARL